MNQLATKTPHSLNYLCHTLFSCSASVKTTAYNKAAVRPVLEYASPVWCLHSAKDVSQLELIQRRAAHWVCNSRWSTVSSNWPKSSNFCMQELDWSPLHTRRSFFSISLTHDILHSRVATSFSRYFQFFTTITRSHPMTLCTVLGKLLCKSN